jgi:hypothetical protein
MLADRNPKLRADAPVFQPSALDEFLVVVGINERGDRDSLLRAHD